MNVAELIERLQEMDPEAEVRIATQPNWPLQAALAGVVSAQELAEHKVGEEKCEEHDFYNCLECYEAEVAKAEKIVWLAEGSQDRDDPYASRLIWDIAN